VSLWHSRRWSITNTSPKKKKWDFNKKNSKKFGNKKYFIYLCKTEMKCGFGVTVALSSTEGENGSIP
jgi:hypothetical protein